MKTPITFSLETKILSSFMEIIDNNKDDKNRIIEKLIIGYVSINQSKEITCKKCNAIYSSKIKECPQCSLMDRDKLAKESEAQEEEIYRQTKKKKIEELKLRIKKKREHFTRWTDGEGNVNEEFKDHVTPKQLEELQDEVFLLQGSIDKLELSLREKEVLGEHYEQS